MMSCWKPSLIALGALSSATAVSASDVNSAASIGANAFGQYVTAFPAGTRYDPAQVLKQLNRVCASDTAFDRQRCAKAWRIINDAHTELQAKRAAKAAATATN
jgi:hypothetical protein